MITSSFGLNLTMVNPGKLNLKHLIGKLKGRKHEWRKAKLDPTTGILECKNVKSPKDNQIPGWVYRVRGEGQPARPTKCPRCDTDYHRRENNPSPLRNHRTGFQKACQVIASGLAREMPEVQMSDKSSRKLVIFSDSRQDAAKLAAGMERDHYRDLVRMALMKSFNEYWDDLVGFLRYHSSLSQIPPNLSLLNQELCEKVSEPSQPDDLQRRNQFAARNDGQLVMEANAWWMDAPPFNQKQRDVWIAVLGNYPGPVPLRNLRGTIADLLLGLGVNIGGSTFQVKGYDSGKNRKPWFTCYEWNDIPVTSIVPLQQEQERLVIRMETNLMGELMYAIFPSCSAYIRGACTRLD